MAPHIQTTVADGVFVLTLNRPSAGNALALQTFEEMKAAIQQAASDDAVRALVVTGNGKYFSTGADVKSIAGSVMEDPASMGSVLRNGSAKVASMLIDFPKITIAAVNGPVVGWPAGMLGVFDMVVVSDTASYQAPFVHLGIVPEGCSTYTLPRTVGRALANDIWFTNRTLSADEMVACGLASRKLPTAGFREAALQMVTAGATAAAPTSVVASKRLQFVELRQKLQAANNAETDAVIAQFESGVPVKRFMKVAQSIGSGKKNSKL